MSELSSNLIPETQVNEEESSIANEHDNTVNSSINDSQDFHLIAEDETQVVLEAENPRDEDNSKVEKHEVDGIKTIAEARDSDNDKAKAVVQPESSTTLPRDADKSDNDDLNQEKKSKEQDNQENNDINDNEDLDESDEIVQCTPTEEMFTPRRRVMASGQKRKAEEEKEEGVKFQRTSSREDALDSVRNKLDEVEDSQPVDENAKALPNSSPLTATPTESSKSSLPNNPEGSVIPEDPKEPMEVDSTPEVPPEAPPSPQPTLPSEDTELPLAADSTADTTSAPTSKKSRMSIEVIYDKSLAPPSKPKELVEIDEDGEKIILDASQEDVAPVEASYKTCESKASSDSYKSLHSPQNDLSIDPQLTNGNDDKTPDADTTLSTSSSTTTFADTPADSKTSLKPPEVLNLVSDSEGDSFLTDDKPKPKIVPMEKELNVIVKVKCLLHVNDTTKEITGKEFLSIDFDHLSELHLSRRRNSDASALADVSDNKDPTSPGSVTSNPQTYPLNPSSRLSLMSSASTSSSSSSGSGKTVKDSHFSLPRGIPKHAKKDSIDEASEKLKKEWKNVSLLTNGILSFVNAEVLACDLHNGTTEDALRLTASTPEAQAVLMTPKSSKKGRAAKRTRQNSRSSRANGVSKASPAALATIESKSDTEGNDSVVSELSTPSRQSARSLSILRNQTPVYDPSDALVGKDCFAKWSDNNYYPGKVISKSKGKFKVNFLDGKNKILIEDFVIPMLKPLGEGLSIYATTPDDGYGSCGIIIAVEKVKDHMVYHVETDEGDKIKVGVKDIFLTSDQAQLMKEALNEEVRSPSSATSMGKVTMDNIVEGTRRAKASIGTPKSGRSKGRGFKNEVEPSGSGLMEKLRKEETGSDTAHSAESECEVEGVQEELEGKSEMGPKGPASRVKGKGRNRKKDEDQEMIATFGPIPEGSNLFKGMRFILSCAPQESLDRFRMDKPESTNSEVETENEADWNRIPFMRERLTAQIKGGGGLIYEEFEDIPKEEYENTKLITNLPNTTQKSLLCLSVGICGLNHRWVIRCCQQNKLVNTSEEALPAGWSFDRESYIDMYQRPNPKPLSLAVVVMPKISSNERSIEFWRRVIANAGGVCRIVENPAESFMEATVVLANEKCPSWLKEKAANWNIPLASTTWLVQSLIEGKPLPYDGHPLYQHNPPRPSRD